MIRHYVTVEDALEFHKGQLAAFGGAEGVRDEGALASALFRPQSGYYKDLIAEAAALWESMAQNHPFVDGNKRTSLVVTNIFLMLNGVIISARDEDVWPFMLAQLEQGTFTFEVLEAWLRDNTQPI